MKNKIFLLKNLQKKIQIEKKKGKKIILCHGVFDLLHIGHIKHLSKAKDLGDILVVSITPDKYVNKGPGRPAFNENLRADAISAMQDVDYVSINETATAVNVIKKIKPNIFCKGNDYKNNIDDITGEIKNEIKEIKKYKGKIVYTDEISFSSSRLINNSTNFYSPNQKKIIKKISKNFQFKAIKKIVDNFKNIKILVIGETIIDQYNFCEAVGKSGKEPILVLKQNSKQQYFGGVLSIAQNLSKFSNKVSIISTIGEKKEYLKDINLNIPKSIKKNFIYKKNSPTIVKKRFVDSLTKNKIIGVYKINDEILSSNDEKIFNKLLNREIPKHDLVIVSDYGHGMISKISANLICRKSKFLALNAQVNATNIGYHTIRNYKNFNTLIINEKEMRHEMRDKINNLEILMSNLSKEKNIKNVVVTRGATGSILYHKVNKKFYYSEAFARKIIDKIGAGDTMLAVLAMCIKNKIDQNLTLLISSLAAAQSVETLGNKNTLSKINMLKTIENILK